MSTTNKERKVNFGSLDPLIRDIATVYDFYFDQNHFIETEVKTFLREFEGKRGDRDIFALNQTTLNANNTIINARKSIQHALNNLDHLNKSVDDMNNKLKKEIELENVHQEQRDNDRVNKFEFEEIERKKIEEQFQMAKNDIDTEFHEKSSQLRDKYQIIVQ
ncbi:hypothetical protein CYY_002341 [Polysphondylium violaceum]|uniref:Biogenesis of lysosome-related organelles complex 1 subunit 5 n=1 Tax=Polysphondylium violaceum TaxID=133409 RepID=A0A8J4V0V9_9MYCE|nr:hypothetical protein CYY_002341 [Polysphondylium violaceum]